MSTRRRKILLAATSAGLMTRLGLSLAAEKNPQVLKAIESNVSDAKALLSKVAATADKMDDKAAFQFVEKEASLRRQLWDILSPVPRGQLIDYVLPGRLVLAEAMQRADLALLPEKPEIIAIPVKSTSASPQCEAVVPILVDIILEALDLKLIKEAILKVIEQTPELQQWLDELAQKIKLRDAKQVIEVLAKIIEKCTEVGMLDLLTRLLGREEAKRVWRLLLKKIGLRFVPFVGQLYTLIAVATALFNNSARLIAAIKC